MSNFFALRVPCELHHRPGSARPQAVSLIVSVTVARGKGHADNEINISRAIAQFKRALVDSFDGIASSS